MAFHEFQVQVHNDSLLPEDDSINILYYEVNFPETVRGTMDDIAAAYATIGGVINNGYGGMSIKAYDAPGVGGPIDQADYPLTCGGAASPSEVALCLSYSATDDAAGAPRKRGRIYLPIGANAARPTSFLIGQILTFGETLAQVGTAGNTTWHLFSRTNQDFPKIESISCDDSWDTQRRRGLAPTVRTRRDVQ